MLNFAEGHLVLDRTLAGQPIAEDYGTIRRKPYTETKVELTLFIDTSSVEVFVNQGEAVFTSRLFPNPDSQGLKLFAEDGACKFDATVWSLGSEFSKESSLNFFQ